MEQEPVSQYEIREATLADVPGVRRVQSESWLVTYPNEERDVPLSWVQERIKRWLTPEKLEESKQIVAKVISDPTQFYRLATLGDKIVGFVHVLTKEDGVKELEAIYTDPTTFGSGLAQQLMEQADGWIEGVDVTLVVASYNNRAIRFYEKCGFMKIEGSEHMYADKISVIRMKREGNN
jgi:ribosomal protein S18 acetylase RimI-like enzyme